MGTTIQSLLIAIISATVKLPQPLSQTTFNALSLSSSLPFSPFHFLSFFISSIISPPSSRPSTLVQHSVGGLVTVSFSSHFLSLPSTTDFSEAPSLSSLSLHAPSVNKIIYVRRSKRRSSSYRYDGESSYRSEVIISRPRRFTFYALSSVSLSLALPCCLFRCGSGGCISYFVAVLVNLLLVLYFNHRV